MRKKWKRSAAIGLMAVFLAISAQMAAPSAATAGAAAASPAVKVMADGEELHTEAKPFLENGVTYLPIRELGGVLGTVVHWHDSLKTVTMTYPERTVKLRYGSKEADVNGKPVKLSASLKLINGRMYAPLRFFSENIGADVAWDNKSKTVSVTKPNTYMTGIGVNVNVWLNRGNGDLYIAYPYEQPPVKAGSVDMNLQGYVSIEAYAQRDGNKIVKIVDNFGEPMVHTAEYAVLVHDNKIVDQKSARYFQRYERNAYAFEHYEASGWVQHYMLTDGKTVTIYDGQGRAEAAYDLPKLTGKDETFAVLGAGKHFLVVRPNATGLLTLINLDDQSVVELPRVLLSGSELEYALTNDVPYHGDTMAYAGTNPDESELYFAYDNPFDNTTEPLRLTYKRNAAK